MKEATILKKVIEQAVRGGWDKKEADCFWRVWDRYGQVVRDGAVIPALIFDHDFAKAYWKGDRGIVNFYEAPRWWGFCIDCGKKFKGKEEIEKIRFGHKKCPEGKSPWQHHLQQLVISENRLEYLKQFLKK